MEFLSPAILAQEQVNYQITEGWNYRNHAESCSENDRGQIAVLFQIQMGSSYEQVHDKANKMACVVCMKKP